MLLLILKANQSGCKPEISAYCVASEAVKTQLINWDVRAEKIKVCGIPLDESFTVKQDPAKIESNFKLNERPLILLMGGGMGPTRMDEVAADLLQYGENLQIVALPGRDLAVRQKLEKLANSKTVTLFVCGWTGQVAGLMQMATLLITKPGGLTLSEAAACGVPCVFFDAIPGPEEVNAERFVNLGAGILLKDAKETAKAALELLKDTEKLKEMAQSSRKLAQPNAAREIVKIALETLKLSLSNESIFVKPHQFSAYRRFSAFRRRLRLRKTNNLATNSEIIETFSKSSTEVKVR